jgi:hypothetical protein
VEFAVYRLQRLAGKDTDEAQCSGKLLYMYCRSLIDVLVVWYQD